MTSTLVSFEDDPNYAPAVLMKYSCGFVVKAIRSVDTVHFQPHPTQGVSHICNQMRQDDSSVQTFFEMVNDSVKNYIMVNGAPKNIMFSFQNNLSGSPLSEKSIIDRCSELGYTLSKKVKKECGDCNEETYLVVFTNNGVDQASTA
jgi:hypothetical protein